MHWRHQLASRWILCAVLVCVFPACGSSKHSTTGPNTGSLTVTITAPAAIKPSVTVSGPNSYGKVLSATTTLSGLTTGTYTVTAAKEATTATIVSILYTPTITGSPAPVSANETVEVKVSYGQAPGSGNLWVANSTTNFAIVAFDSSQLSVSGSPAPAISILPNGGSLVTPSATAFDTSGRMWVLNPNGNSLVAYNPAQIAASGAPTPAITILPDSGSLAGPFGMAFDAKGNLWIVNLDSGNVVAYSPQQLQASGAPVPAIILKSTTPFFVPEGIAFDAHGNLWVSSWTHVISAADTVHGNLQEFTASQLTKAGAQTLTPAITLTGQGLQFVSSIAFDVSGNLWLTDDVDTIAQYRAAQLAAGGAQTPTVVIIDGLAPPCNFPPSPAPYCNGPDGLAFDNSGNLWVTNGVASGTESIIKYTPSQLSQSGSPTPAVVLTRNGTSIFGSVGLTFYPHASGLPIH
jgi:sugar lactone lactonase YvrE